MISQFALVSGTGWVIDFAVFYGLARAGLPVYLANIVGASLAVVFVFFASLRPIFLYEGNRTPGKLLQYVVYQCVAIPLASMAIDALSEAGIELLWSKVLVTPLTFVCNFLFMRFLARRPEARGTR